MTKRVPVVVGMRVRLRKRHPCGDDEWSVVRTGADVGLVCAGCGRRIMLEREEFERRIKEVLEIPAAVDASPSSTPSTSGESEL